MTPPTLDVLVLTFNCAKNLINVDVFASHLQDAFRRHGGELPELVVFSLQEVAPLSYSFIGGYFLTPYLARYDETLNLAASRYADAAPSSPTGPHIKPYTLVRARNVGMTALLLFARDPAALADVREAETGFGAAEMGNKGAVGVRLTYKRAVADGETTTTLDTELTFVATHLAAMEWNLARRNANWATIVRELTFENPEDVVRPKKKNKQGGGAGGSSSTGGGGGSGGGGKKTTTRTTKTPRDEPVSDETAEEHMRLLHGEHRAHETALRARLHDLSVFRPSSYLFVAGDLNYRISTSSPPPLATFPSLDPDSESYYPNFFPLDQLTRERRAGRTMHGLSEAPVAFPPTYKYVVLPPGTGPTPEMGPGLASTAVAAAAADGADEQERGGHDEDENQLLVTRQGSQGEVVEPEPSWLFAPHRYPSWTDRVLYLDVPRWARARGVPAVSVAQYDCLPVVRTSDHRAVFLRARVPLLAPRDMRPPAAVASSEASNVLAPPLEGGDEWEAVIEDGSSGSSGRSGSGSGGHTTLVVDPRLRLPIEIDPEAWERRAAARRREVMAGWSMFLWSTRQGAAVLGAVALLGFSSWWLATQV